jgi:hypothetical protein
MRRLETTMMTWQRARFILLAALECLVLGFTCLRGTPCAAQDDEAISRYKILDVRGVYELKPTLQTNAPAKVLLDPGHPPSLNPPDSFFWIVRRAPCFLISGDLPRFALGRNLPAPELDPKIGKLGDLRIRITVTGKSYWLDEVPGIHATFHPWGTAHHLSAGPDFPLDVEVRATMVENTGIAIEIDLGANSPQPLDGVIDLSYGGLARLITGHAPTGNPALAKTNVVTVEKDGGAISDPAIPVQVEARTNPAAQPTVDPTNRLDWQFPFALKQSRSVFRLMAFQQEPGQSTEPNIDRFDEYVQVTRKYYETLLNTIEIQTPDRVLDTGLYAALLNLDYDYSSPAWFEALYHWNAYWVNNYQISAAIDLGQLDRARRALIFFASRPDGPGQAINADASPYHGDEFGSNWTAWTSPSTKFEEGLPYYILELYRYWLATGDRKTLDAVWPATKENLERLLKTRDPDGNMLLDWMQGGNMFLYQSDHLNLPGDAFSPSIMVAGNLDQMAEMAEARGESGDAERWRHRAAYMRSELVRRFWLPQEGRFISDIDGQGLVMKANFYTDFVYPQLYSDLPLAYTWTSLRTLDRTLWMKNDLMREGNYKPPNPGNDVVAPVQMAEAAEAYLQAGVASRGARLLHATALGATTATYSPGAFSDSMQYGGVGLPSYVFGNPAGSYARAVVSGLFGLEPAASGRPLKWHPSIPDDWPSAKLRTGGITMQITGARNERSYSLDLPEAQAVDLRVPLYGRKVEEVKDASGAKLAFTVQPYPSGNFLEVHLAPATELKITVRSTPGPALAVPAPEPPPEPVRSGAQWMAGKREPLPVESKFNSDSIMTRNVWRHEPIKIEFPSCAEGSPSGCDIPVGKSSFHVLPKGRNIMVIEVGENDPYMQQLQPSNLPSWMDLPVGKSVRALEFLTATELATRLTGVQVGAVHLRYATGGEVDAPLIYGRNIDCFSHPFAIETDNYKVAKGVLSAFVVKTDASRKLEEIKIQLYAADASLGVLGINLVLP